MSNLLDRSSIILTPTAYDNSEVLCVKPSDGSGDFSFSRATEATRINSLGLVEVVADNLPRINYEGGCGSWLWEPQSTNLYLNSETLSTQTITTTANQYSVSFYGTGTITFSGTHTGSLIGTGLNDRVTATFSATAGTLTSTVSGTVTKAQIEQLSFATSYIPTDGTSVTRNQDLCTNGGSLASINSTSGVLYAEIASLTQDDTFRIISLCDGGDENRVSIAYNNQTNEVIFAVKVNNVNQISFIKTLTDTTSFHKFAISYKLNEFKVYIDGVQETIQLSGSVYPANTLNELTFDRGLSSFPFFGKTKCLAVWKETLTDTELAELTTI